MPNNRNKQITIKLTQSEYDHIQDRLKHNNTTFMATIRKIFKLPEPLPMRGSKEYQVLKHKNADASQGDTNND